MGRLIIRGLQTVQARHHRDKNSEEANAMCTYEADIPPAWLTMQPRQLREELDRLGYARPDVVRSDPASVKLEVVSAEDMSSYECSSSSRFQIRENETFASWWTQVTGGHAGAEVTHTNESVSVYGSTISFERTLRVPDSGEDHRLPPSMGTFPVTPVETCAASLPELVAARGGYILPMYQREALWIRFSHRMLSHNAIKASVGGINALTGVQKGEPSKSGVQDYLCKSQPWLDGIVKESGKVRQFVTMPVSQGYTIEEQLTGKNTEATLQLDVFPAFRQDVEVKLGDVKISNLLQTPMEVGAKAGDSLMIRPRTSTGEYDLASMLRFCGGETLVFEANYHEILPTCPLPPAGPAFLHAITRGENMPKKSQSVSLGIAAGGSITQQINEDEADPALYDFDAGKRIYIHFINSGVWKSITGKEAPISPVTKKAYSDHCIPWFDLYNEPKAASGLGAGFKNIKSVNDIDKADRKDWEDSKDPEGDTAQTSDEKLFGERWQKGEGTLVGINASVFSRFNITCKLPFIGSNMPETFVCRTAHRSGDLDWTYASDDVARLLK